MPSVCLAPGCETVLSRPRRGHTPTGYCRSCNPARKWSPEARANASAARKARWARELATPEGRAAAVASGQRLKATSLGRDVVAKQIEGRRARHWSAGQEALNHTLRAKGFLAAERRQIIEADAARRDQAEAAAAAAREAAITPFERQLARVRAGARLIEKPVLRRVDPAFTLGGVAPEAM